MDSDELLNGWFQSKHSEMRILFFKKKSSMSSGSCLKTKQL